MSTRKVEFVAQPTGTHYVGNGFKVHTFFPSSYRLSIERMSPFVLLDYNAKFHVDPSEEERGVGAHPHKGFETVTIAYKGKVEHHDSYGGGGVIQEGDVQWMTAASGVLHKEFFEKEWNKKGGEFQMVQLWVNLPAEDKKSAPKYQAIKDADVPRFFLSEGQGEISVIAGEYKGIKGAASTFTPVNLFNAKLNPKGKVSFDFPEYYNTALLVLEGHVEVGGEEIPTDHLALMENKGTSFTVEAVDKDALVLVMSGEPIDEPIVARGPFVMNTGQELAEAIMEFNEGKFGHLE